MVGFCGVPRRNSFSEESVWFSELEMSLSLTQLSCPLFILTIPFPVKMASELYYLLLFLLISEPFPLYARWHSVGYQHRSGVVGCQVWGLHRPCRIWLVLLSLWAQLSAISQKKSPLQAAPCNPHSLSHSIPLSLFYIHQLLREVFKCNSAFEGGKGMEEMVR